MIVSFYTLGCKVNHYETQAMEELFLKACWRVVPFGEPADVIVVNTCSVTAASDAKSRQMIRRAHKLCPDAQIIAVGCFAQTAPEAALGLDGVSLVLGTDGRKAIVSHANAVLAAQAAKQSLVTPAFSHRAFEPLSAVRDSRTRATLKIQDGCTNFCAYCIIPYARGPLRSRPLDEITRETERLAFEGYREIVLTGIHLASYGRDLGGCDLTDAIKRVSAVDGVSRVRLGSLEPNFVTERVAALLAENDKLCRQFHLSLQSGSDAVLARMNRRYTANEYRADVARLRNEMPNCAVTTDVIAGYCGETLHEHAETLAFCEDVGFSRMHVFPFSVRAGTKAASLSDSVPKREKERRAAELIRLSEQLSHRYLVSRVGAVVDVLAESDHTGYSGDYIRVKTDAREGEIVRMRITGVETEIERGVKTEIAIGEEISI